MLGGGTEGCRGEDGRAWHRGRRTHAKKTEDKAGWQQVTVEDEFGYPEVTRQAAAEE